MLYFLRLMKQVILAFSKYFWINLLKKES